jgi:hypothetical protein
LAGRIRKHTTINRPIHINLAGFAVCLNMAFSFFV